MDLRKTFINGIVLFIPLIFLIFVVAKCFDFILNLVDPVSKLFIPDYSFLNSFPRLASLILILIFVMVLGLISNTKFAGKFLLKIQEFIPGFIVFKNILMSDKDQRSENLKTCVATIDDAWLFGFIVEEHESGMLTVFIPSAPSPTGGNVYFMREDQIKRIDAPARQISKHIMQFGYGSKTLLDAKVKWDISNQK